MLGRQPKLIATMKKLFFIFIGTVLAISADATELISATSIQTCVISKLDAQQKFFSVTGYYYQNRQAYKCKLKLKLAQSVYGQNSYIAVEYATDYFNNQWYWHRCNASCQYDAVNRQHYVTIGYNTIYFDDPLE